ncbi:MAG TPA: cupredoxin domain-containing protein [Dehalococcoidia bacterium]|nr:cupredoxin domain-containing protein [Dehalococcoidia bacterium]
MSVRRRLSPRLLLAFVALGAVAAACGGGGLYGRSATATRTPASATAAVRPAARPDYAGNETPTPSATAAPVEAPAPTQAPAPSPTPAPPTAPPEPMAASPAGPVSLTVVARGIRFEQTELTVDAGAQVTLTFDNQDAVSHNVDIVGVAKTDIFAGPGQATITFTAPPPGTYAYRCDVHPGAMQGTLVVR